MVQSAEYRQRENASDRLDRSRQRCVLGQRQMCSGAIIVTRVRAQHMAQMTLAKHDHMIKALASDRADQSFGIARSAMAFAALSVCRECPSLGSGA